MPTETVMTKTADYIEPRDDLQGQGHAPTTFAFIRKCPIPLVRACQMVSEV